MGNEDAIRVLDHGFVRLVTLGGGCDEVHPELRARDHQRVADVVPVSQIRDADAVELAEALTDRHHVGERLARVGLVREPVDDRDVRVGGQLIDVRLRERTDHDPVEVARKNAGRVLDRLAAAELQVACREVERRAPEVEHPCLEGDARSMCSR